MQRVALIALLSVVLPACASGATNGSRHSSEPTMVTETAVSDIEQRATAGSSAASSFAGMDLDRFSKRRAMDHVRKLAGDIGVRVRTTRNETLAIRYAKKRFEALGYNTHVQKFSVDGSTSRNVVAWWPDAKRYPFVIGGHIDSVPGAPGANDNASGIAAILEMARLVAGKEQARWIRFVAFGSEEFGGDGSHHVGSTVYVNRLGSEGRRRLAGMVSVDMVADGGLIVGNSGISDDVVARMLYDRIRDVGIPVVYRTSCDCSDNGPFEHAGMPASYMWTGDEPDYHSPTDTVPNLDPEDLLRTGRALRAFVKVFDKGYLDRMRRG